jgi:hypothetical protein
MTDGYPPSADYWKHIPSDSLLEVPRNPKYCPRCNQRCKYEGDQNNHPLDLHRCPDPECAAVWDCYGEVQFWARTPRAKLHTLAPTKGVKGMGKTNNETD